MVLKVIVNFLYRRTGAASHLPQGLLVIRIGSVSHEMDKRWVKRSGEAERFSKNSEQHLEDALFQVLLFGYIAPAVLELWLSPAGPFPS